MTLIDIINENVAKNFEKTENVKEADLIVYIAQNERFSKSLFITGSIANNLIGYRLDQHNQFRETCNGSADENKSDYIEVTMYKAKSEDIKKGMPWVNGEPNTEQLRDYFKQ